MAVIDSIKQFILSVFFNKKTINLFKKNSFRTYTNVDLGWAARYTKNGKHFKRSKKLLSSRRSDITMLGVILLDVLIGSVPGIYLKRMPTTEEVMVNQTS